MSTVTFITRRGCHLCDRVFSQLQRSREVTAFELEILDVDADPQLRAEYGDQVPVVLIDGVQHSYFDLDEARFLAAVTASRNPTGR